MPYPGYKPKKKPTKPGSSSVPFTKKPKKK
jgi:hypothetical protein